MTCKQKLCLKILWAYLASILSDSMRLSMLSWKSEKAHFYDSYSWTTFVGGTGACLVQFFSLQSGYKLCLLKSLHIESYYPYCQSALSLLNFAFLCLKIIQAACLASILCDSLRLSMLSKGWFCLIFETFPLFWYKHLKSETLVSLLFDVFLYLYHVLV